MTAIREFIKVKNHQVTINLPNDFNYEEVEVIVMPHNKQETNYWSNEELYNIGKIGLHSKSFESDDEDYSKW
jgi:hypothetical protein